MQNAFLIFSNVAEKMSSTLCLGSSSHFAILIFLGGNGEMCRHLSLLVPDILTATNQNDILSF
jgi:hypothetical protein